MKVKNIAAASAAIALALCGCSGGSTGPGQVDVWAITDNNMLVKFDFEAAAQTDSSVAITGLQGGETIVGMDFRPFTGQLMAVGSTGRLYVINAGTGVATQVGPLFSTALLGTDFGVDFSPSSDRVRVVSDVDQNVRVNPNTADVTVDTSLNPTADIVGLAYNNNFPSAAISTAFGLDASTDNLVRIGGVNGIPSANGGAVTVIGSTGVDVTATTGFDIHRNGTAVMVVNTGANSNSVYQIDLVTGGATLVGTNTTAGNIVAIAVR